jgi:hypothetical protein
MHCTDNAKSWILATIPKSEPGADARKHAVSGNPTVDLVVWALADLVSGQTPYHIVSFDLSFTHHPASLFF